MNLYHYCSNAAFLSIISKREIWASEFSLSNDMLEGKWIREVFTQYCAEKKVQPLDKEALLQNLDTLIAYSGGTGFCMSEEADLLSQWRGYADDGCGVSIGFSKEYFEELGPIKRDRNDDFNASITKVEYDVDSQKKLIAEYADPIFELAAKGALQPRTLLTPDDEAEQRDADRRSIFLRFIFFFVYLYRFKNPAFAEEREWRLISHIMPNPESDHPGNELSKMEFRPLRDRMVPFRPIPLEQLTQPAIREIVIGPKNITPGKIVDAALKKHNWTDIAIRRSRASYRS